MSTIIIRFEDPCEGVIDIAFDLIRKLMFDVVKAPPDMVTIELETPLHDCNETCDQPCWAEMVATGEATA